MLKYSSPPRVTAGGRDLQPSTEDYGEGETCRIFAARLLRLSMSAGCQAAPHPRDPGILLSLTLLVTWYLCQRHLPWGTCLLFPQLQILASPTCVSHPLWNLGKISVLWFASRVSQDLVPSLGRVGSSRLTALCNRPPPALALSPRSLHRDSGCLGLRLGLWGGCGGGFRLPLCSSSPKGLLPPGQCRGQKRGLSGWH